MDKLSKVRAEIERRIDYQNKCIQNHYRLTGKAEEEIILEYKQLLAFIDSLQKEPVSDDLEKAAVEAFKQIVDSDKNNFLEIFKAGAKWQEKKDQETIELAEDHAMFAGMEKMREQMMKDAVDMVVGYWMPNGLSLNVDETENIYNIDDGDKVKMLIIKDE